MKKRFILSLGVGSIVVALVVLTMSCYVLPRRAAQMYQKDVEKTAKLARPSFRNLGKTADLPVYGDLAQPEATHRSNLSSAAASLDSAAEKTAMLSKVCGHLPVYAPLTFSRDYRNALLLKHRCYIMIRQTKVVTKEYEQLITYLSEQLALQTQYRSIVNPVTGTDDLNMLFGAGEQFAAQSAELHDVARRTRALQTPRDMIRVRDSLELTYTQTADAFAQLAAAANSWDDAEIFDAATAVETAVGRNDTLDMQNYDSAMRQSPTVKWVREIDEKLDMLER